MALASSGRWWRPLVIPVRPAVVAIGALLAACGSPPTPQAAAPPPASTSAVPQPAPRQRLLVALGELEPPDVLEALPGDLRGVLDDQWGALSAEEQAAHGAPAAAARAPLLHLRAGGTEPAAYLALATGAAASEILALATTAGNEQHSGLADPITRLTEAAAVRWLGDIKFDLARREDSTLALAGQIDRVAAVLHRQDLQLLARQTAADFDRTPESELAVVRALAWQLQANEAGALLDSLRRDAAKEGLLTPGLVRQVDEAATVVEASRTASDASGVATIAAAVRRARALLQLGQEEQARRILEPYRARAGEHLALGAATVLADFSGTACPGLPPFTPNIVACAAHWRESPLVQSSIELLESAWGSHQGRDDAAIETYLGLVHVIPWFYATMGDRSGDVETLLTASQQSVRRLQLAIAEVAEDHKQFAGLELFNELLLASVDAVRTRGPGERVSLDPARQDELTSRARALAARLPQEPHAQAAILGVAAMLAQDRDAGTLVGLLPAAVKPRHRLALWSLLLWTGLVDQRPDDLERAKDLLLQLLDESAPSFDRSTLVLTMAEAEAALDGSQEAYARLDQVAEQLGNLKLPVQLRLRVALDRAGVLERQAARQQAIELLATVASEANPSGTAEQIDLMVLARAYLIYLRALEVPDAERDEYAAHLKDLVHEVAGQVSVGVLVATQLWIRELDYLAAIAQCMRVRCARARLEQRRPAPYDEVRKMVGTESARLAARGVLPLGAVTASLTYSPETGLRPSVVLQPVFLSVPIPALSRPAAGAK